MKGPTDIHKVYGQIWNLKSDQLTLNLKKQAPFEEGKLFTKRECLSQVMSLYDLSGFAAPYHLKAKLVFQKSCETKMGWDDKLPPQLQQEFKKWIEELSQLENFTITRSFLPVTFQEVSVAAFREVNAGRENMLHSFRDASNVGLGVNCYVVTEGPNGTRYSELAFCKAKVLPQSQNFRKIWQPQY